MECQFHNHAPQNSLVLSLDWRRVKYITTGINFFSLWTERMGSQVHNDHRILSPERRRVKFLMSNNSTVLSLDGRMECQFHNHAPLNSLVLSLDYIKTYYLESSAILYCNQRTGLLIVFVTGCLPVQFLLRFFTLSVSRIIDK